MSGQVADVETDLMEDSQDIIAEETEKFYQREFETLKGNAPSEDQDSSEEEEVDQPAPEPRANGKRPGIDAVLKETESKLGKDYADVVRTVQDDYRRTRTEWKTAQREWQSTLEELQKEISALKNPGAAGEKEGAEEDPDLAALSPKQLELFRKLARKEGLISKEDVQREEQETQAKSYVKAEVERGLKEFGDRFGHVDEDGEFVFSDDVADEVQEHYVRVFDPKRGLTSRDIFILSQFDKLMADANAKIEEASKTRTTQRARVDQARKAALPERRSTTVPSSSPGVYRKGESLEKTIARAAAQAYREV